MVIQCRRILESSSRVLKYFLDILLMNSYFEKMFFGNSRVSIASVQEISWLTDVSLRRLTFSNRLFERNERVTDKV